MRTLWILLLSGALAWGSWTLLSEDEDPGRPVDPYAEPSDRKEILDPARRRVSPTTGALVVRVRTTGGHIPGQAKAGYRHRGETRLKALDAQGQVLFTDAPLGDLVVLARAPGYADATQPRYLTSGIRTDVVLTLRTPDEPKK